MSVNTPNAAGNEKILMTHQVTIEPVAYDSTAQLFQDLRDFLARHPGLDGPSIQILSFFIFTCMFPECTQIWPFVSITAADTASSALLIRLLKCVLPEFVHLGELNLPGILSLPGLRREVLLLDQIKPSKEMERVLRLMSRAGAQVVSRGQLREISRPVLLCTSEPLLDQSLLDQSIQLTLAPTGRRLPYFDPQSLEEASRRIRGQLVRYRAENLAKVRESSFDAPTLISPIRQIAALLGGCIIGDSDLQAQVVPLLRNQDWDSRVRRENSFQAVAVEAGLFLCHETPRTEARIGEFATIMNGILRGRGETIELEPREVGNLLRGLGFFTQRLGRAGRGIRFRRDVRQKFHELAWAFDVCSLEDRLDRCEFCPDARARYDDAV